MFSGSAIGGKALTCSKCGLTLHSRNLVRHKRVKQALILKLPVEGPVSTQPAMEKLIIKLPMEKEARKRSAREEEHRGLMPHTNLKMN